MAITLNSKTLVTFIGLAILAISTAMGADSVDKVEPFEANASINNDKPMTNPDRKTLVIYFSRSGNTEMMAQEIAKHYRASILHLQATDYRSGLRGLINAVVDSRSKHAAITPAKIHLSHYDTIFIGAPIWWQSPAPPVWQFIDNHDFTGSKVVLFTTFNSSYKQIYIDEFQAMVEKKGGEFIKHIYTKRGRMINQIDDETLRGATTRLELNKLPLQ